MLCLILGVSGARWDDVQAQSTNLVVESVSPPEPPSVEDAGFSEEDIVDSWRTPEGLPDNAVNALLQTRDGYLWVGTDAGAARFDGVRFTPLTDLNESAKNMGRVTALCEDQVGNLWIGTQGHGLFCYSQGRLRSYTTRDGLTDDTISSVVETPQGELLAGTQSGLDRLTTDALSECRTDDRASLGAISGIHIGKSGRLWVTTRSGIYERRNGRLALLQFGEAVPETKTAGFNGVYSDSKGNFWAYGETFLLNLNEGKRFNYFRSPNSSASRSVRGGNGLLNMRLRLADVGGEFLIRSHPGKGTEVGMILHLPKEALIEPHSEN